jgi:sRNA-binding carbon storage regulator CsrA
MALVLSLKQGDAFYINTLRLEIGQVDSAELFMLHMAGKKEPLAITDREAIEVVPDVHIASGGFHNSGLIRVTVDAPREIEILREEKYRAKYGADRK